MDTRLHWAHTVRCENCHRIFRVSSSLRRAMLALVGRTPARCPGCSESAWHAKVRASAVMEDDVELSTRF